MKKPTKRKMYQKRRKKEKAEQRRKSTKPLPPRKSGTAFHIYSKMAQNEYNTNKNNSHQQIFSPITSYSQGLQLWWQTYCSAIEFHSRQQNAPQVDGRESYSMLLQKYANEYETSSEEEEENEVEQWLDTYEAAENINEIKEEYVDQEYIQFLEITHRHQEEIRLKRAKEDC